MVRNRLNLFFLMATATALVGCSPPASEATDNASTTSAPKADAPPAASAEPAAPVAARQDAKACDLVTAEEMSAILGRTVTAHADESSSGETKCFYTAASALSPVAMFSVDWDDGKIAMAATGRMNQMEPGIADPYAGIGDQAAAVGPMLWILSGEDLIQIRVTGDDVTTKARKVFETAKAKM